MVRKRTTMKCDLGESRSAGGGGGATGVGACARERERKEEENARKHLASTSPPSPVAVSGSSSGAWAPTQAASFWSRQNWRVHVRHGVAGLTGRYSGMMVAFSLRPKQVQRQKDMPLEAPEEDEVERAWAGEERSRREARGDKAAGRGPRAARSAAPSVARSRSTSDRTPGNGGRELRRIS